jgi:hypothetical protein
MTPYVGPCVGSTYWCIINPHRSCDENNYIRPWRGILREVGGGYRLSDPTKVGGSGTGIIKLSIGVIHTDLFDTKEEANRAYQKMLLLRIEKLQNQILEITRELVSCNSSS